VAREVAGHFWSISKKALQLHGKNEVGSRYGAAAATNEYAIGARLEVARIRNRDGGPDVH
jgi:hypothetical protein